MIKAVFHHAFLIRCFKHFTQNGSRWVKRTESDVLKKCRCQYSRSFETSEILCRNADVPPLTVAESWIGSFRDARKKGCLC